MSIESPATYSDWYWRNSVDASGVFDEQLEATFAPYFAGILNDIPGISELPTGVRNFLEAFAEPPSAGFGDLIKLTGGEFAAELIKDGIEPGVNKLKRLINRSARETWLNSDQANTLFRRGKIDFDLWDITVASEGYESVLGKFLYESQADYPTIPDLVTYSRYHGDADAPWSEIQNWIDISPRDWPVWKWLGLQRLTTIDVRTLYKRGIITELQLLAELAKIGWSIEDRPLVTDIGWTIPNAMLLVQGDLQQEQSNDRIIADISYADIHPKYAQQYLDAILTKPSSQDVIAYQLRKDPDLAGLDPDLRKIGIHPAWMDLYRTLAHPIPPVADIITMAVREAFTPAIAERFGQYEDFPAEFEEWAAKKGLSPEWSKRYWAAHWSLPSATQGFDMLHRGLITPDELDMLLRALDVMPFWREKLTGIAYRRLSRVDIRRMYRVGVLNEDQVYEAYSELGYNERDARRMSDFTIKQVLATQSKFTARDIISAYSKYMISKYEAKALMQVVGVRDENISFILSTAEYKREWELTESRISAIHNLYRKAVYNADKTRAELLKLDMPAERVDVLMEQWYIDEKDKAPRYWTTAQALGFIKAELITPERGRAELIALGYDTEHINVYMESIK